MEIVCQNCNSRFRLPDEKLPSGRMVSVKCSKCDSKIEIDTEPETETATQSKHPQAVVKEVDSGAYDASEKPFDYIQEGMETALVCEHDQGVKQKIRSALEHMNYHLVEAASARNAVKYMRFHVYNLVVLNEAFEAAGAESNRVLQYVSQLPINTRRDMFIVLLGNDFKTADNMTAFNRSVNFVVNPQDIDDIENILKGSITEHEQFYQVFKESLENTGRA